ncbi:hypothetical protein CRP01_30375 [Flavilitoribacter nigricans DSM 23189 = NBRC 102662]|uniref:Uncharacterized protein n=2 Tax=Flavilitoribacter TaxID=2762562 RepID=A0A2D0N2B6_FLAN2|nr:hypothetical protein CRP01_30375 [Flavilitoribacter nigricans DSM 23189 = NBRC 102662]
MQDEHGNTYGFGGNLSEIIVGEVVGRGLVGDIANIVGQIVAEGISLADIVDANVIFKLALFDEEFKKHDEHFIVEFLSSVMGTDDLPINLGYFVMDHEGRVIIVKDGTRIEFVKKDPENHLVVERSWNIREGLSPFLSEAAANHGIAQVIPTFDTGYWVMGLGKDSEQIPSFLAFVDDTGSVVDAIAFLDKINPAIESEIRHEVIQNGMAIDQDGVYIATDWALYKFTLDRSGRIRQNWRTAYERSSKDREKPGVLSKFGSGSTPTLFGKKDDLIAITDNADGRVNLMVYTREEGRPLYKIPLFHPNLSANENTVVAYEDSVVVQNWHNAPAMDENMEGLTPGLARYDLFPDRQSYPYIEWDPRSGPENEYVKECWFNEDFASTATIRLSTATGLLYGTVQLPSDRVRAEYAMTYIDFETGRKVKEVFLGRGMNYRIAMAPAYILPDGTLIQPVRAGMCVIKP